jgi:hypothetical protein
MSLIEINKHFLPVAIKISLIGVIMNKCQYLRVNV